MKKRTLLLLMLFCCIAKAQRSDVSSVPGTPAPGDAAVFDGTQFIFQNPPISGTSNTNRLISGCGVTYTTGLSYVISPCTYSISGITYSSSLTTVTLTAADGSNPRIDALIVNSSSTATKVTGTPAASPATPSIDPTTQLLLSNVTVQAAATTPLGAFLENVYLENTEWTCAASDASNNCASTNNPFAGTKDIEGTTASRGDNVTLTRSSALILSNYSALTFYIRSKAAWGNNCSISATFQLAGVQVGTGVVLSNGAFGFVTSQVSSYQLVVMSMSSFGSISQADKLTLTVTGAGNCSLGYYIDNIILQGGITSTTTVSGIYPIVVAANGVVSCPTCSTNGNSSTYGGFVAGGCFTGSACTVQPFGQSATTSRWAAPSRMWLTHPVVCSNVAAPAGSENQFYWAQQVMAGGDETFSIQRTIVGPTMTAAGCVGNVAAAPIELEEDQRIRIDNNQSGVSPGTVSTVSSAVVGSTSIPMASATGAQTIALSTTNYVSWGSSNTVQATEDFTALPSIAGYARGLCIVTGGTQNAGGSLVATLRIAKADSTLVATVPAGGAAGPYCDKAHTPAVTDGQTLDVKLVNNYSGGVSATIIGVYWELIPTIAGSWMIPFTKNNPQSALTASQTMYWGGMSGGPALQTNAVDASFGIPRVANATKFRCWVQTSPATTSTTFTPFKNGSTFGAAFVATLTTAFSAPGLLSSTGGSVPLAQLDAVTSQSITGSGTGATIAGCVLSGT